MTALGLLVFLPAVFAVIAAFAPGPRAVLGVCVAGSMLSVGVTTAVAISAFQAPEFAFGEQLFLDALSAFYALLVVGVFAFSSIFACTYFAPAVKSGEFDRQKARRFGVLWFLFLASMLLTLAANHVGLMWAGMEATTIASALLICLDRERPAYRAAWTYLVLCSVAIALALLGVIVLCAEARTAGGVGGSVFLWTELRELAPRLRAGPLRLAFVFALVGFGTKAGLAPMHSWLPEAHGQAPTPVSAVLSGVLLNCALYCISRFLPVVDATCPGFAASVLVPFGILSMGIAAAFIMHERDIKRLLAYSSVEHMGIIAVALGFGALPAALFHTFNHSVCKMLTFFCAGTLAQRFGTRDMSRMRGVVRAIPSAGAGFFVGLLALIGLPPFSIFASELWIAQVGVAHGHFMAVTMFAIAAAVVFIAAFRHSVEMTWPASDGAAPAGTGRGLASALVAAPLLVLFVAGLWMPGICSQILERAAAMIGFVP